MDFIAGKGRQPLKDAQPLKFDVAVVDQLACPGCFGNLRLDRNNDLEQLICESCRHAYPILDGIPILIPDQPEH
jgi:uncharacterized protein YbaR (Trm112 family)